MQSRRPLQKNTRPSPVASPLITRSPIGRALVSRPPMARSAIAGSPISRSVASRPTTSRPTTTTPSAPRPSASRPPVAALLSGRSPSARAVSVADSRPDAAALERRMLPSVALQGAVGTLGGFLGFFVVGASDLAGMIQFSAVMLTVAMLGIVLAYSLGPVLRLTGRRLFKLGFMLPGMLLLAGGGSLLSLAAAYGLFLGLTSSARSWLEMSLFSDAQRDGYAVRAGASSVALSLAATFVATFVLPSTGNHSERLYLVYGVACLIGGFFVGKRLPNSPPVALRSPLSVLRRRSFVGCFPLFFLQSGLFGLGLSLSSTGAVQSLKGASSFGVAASAATVVGGLALWASRNLRSPANRSVWMAFACVGVMFAFAMLGASAWIPQLFIAYMILQSAAWPFWAASEHVLNQRTLDAEGSLSDRIVARESVLWVFRMVALGVLWLFAQRMPVAPLLMYGAGMMALVVALQFLIARSWLRPGSKALPLAT